MTMPAPRTWERVLARVEGALIDGSLRPGDRLPAERLLATELGVARSSVREGIRALEVLGLVRTQTGSGPQAGATVIATPQEAMSSLLRLQVAARGLPVDDVVTTRTALEATIVRTLAENRPPLTDATALLDEMDTPGLSPAQFLTLDARFHLALAQAAGNEVVTAIMAGLRSAVEGYVLAGTAAIEDWPGTAQRLRAEHRAVLAAITAGDPDAASACVHEHITGYYTQTRLSPGAHRISEGAP